MASTAQFWRILIASRSIHSETLITSFSSMWLVPSPSSSSSVWSFLFTLSQWMWCVRGVSCRLFRYFDRLSMLLKTTPTSKRKSTSCSLYLCRQWKLMIYWLCNNCHLAESAVPLSVWCFKTKPMSLGWSKHFLHCLFLQTFPKWVSLHLESHSASDGAFC